MLEYLYGKRSGSKIAWANGSGYFWGKPYKIQTPGNYPKESNILDLYIILNENSKKKDCTVSSTLYIQEVHT